jgi:hypothetical protein
MSSQIMSLDFEGAAESAKLFATAAKGINPGLMATQLKSLGSIVLTVGKAFMSMGAALLVNPIFLIAAAIVGVVTIIGVLLNKLGLLKPILNAVGAAFKVVKDVIDAVVQSIKDFLDWLGLTSFAADEEADKQIKAQERIAAARKENQQRLIKAYDQEIALARIAGENTVQTELKKQNAIIATAREEYKLIEAQRKIAYTLGTVGAESAKKFTASMKELRETIEGARNEIQLINAKEVEDNKNKNEKLTSDNKASYAKRIADAKQYELERIGAQRLIRDLEIELMQEGITKDLEVNTEKYARLIADTQKNEKLLADEKTRIIAEYAELQFEAEKAIRQKYDDGLQAQIDLSTANRVAAQQKEQEEFLKRNEDARKAEKEAKDKADAEELAAAKAKTDALLSIEQSLYTSAAALGELFIKDSKKLERFQKAQALIQIGIDTAKAISALVAASQANPANAVTGGLAGVAQFASGIAQILTNVAKAKQLLTSPSASVSGGGGGGSAASSSSASTQAMQPSFNLFGQANQGNNASSSQSVEGSQSMTIFAKVSAVDMTAEQASNQKNMQMATL